MLERLTDRARQVVASAQAEARLLNHGTLSAEHLLLGLLQDGGDAAESLESLGVSLKLARSQVAEIIGDSSGPPRAGHLPFTADVWKILRDLSLVEAQELGRNYIGADDILAALVREDQHAATNVLVGLGADPATVRQVVRTTRVSDAATAARERSNLEKFTGAALQVIRSAQGAAGVLNHPSVGAEHLLLGILHDKASFAARTLGSLGVTEEAALDEIFEIVKHDRVTSSSGTDTTSASRWPRRRNWLQRPFTTGAMIVLDLSKSEARRLGHEHVTVEHILLGLILQNARFATTIESVAALLDGVRDQIDETDGNGNTSLPSGRLPLTARRDEDPRVVQR